MKLPSALAISAFALLLAVPLSAQKKDDDQAMFEALGAKVTLGTGRVSGRVVCGDTGAPARFAKVYLRPVADDSAMMDRLNANAARSRKKNPPQSPEDEAQQKQQLALAASAMRAMSSLMSFATVGADGTFTLINVKPGAYYLHAAMPGYIDPIESFSDADLSSTDSNVRARIAAAVPIVNVNNDSAHADLRLEHGASITGRVLYDDGSPAVGWTVRTIHPDTVTPASTLPGLAAEDMDFAHIRETSATDDTGRFRIAGLNPGKYVLHASMATRPLGSSGTITAGSNAMVSVAGLRLSVYSGNVFRRGDAKQIEVSAGEDQTGADISVPLHALHSLSGHVVAKSDAHPVSSGMVTASATDTTGKPDASMVFNAAINSDGSFRFDYLPGPATYTLKATHAEDSVVTDTRQVLFSPMEKRKTLHTYGPASTTATVGDVDAGDITIQVPDAEASPSAK